MNSASHVASPKAELRRAMGAVRRRLSETERREYSRRIMSACLELPGFSTADVVCSYVNFREEVQTVELLATLLREGRRIAVPVHLHGVRQPLLFAEISSLDELVPNHFGIPQPHGAAARFLPTAAIPLFLVPGLAFDPAGGRLGYGLGFYDRAFADAASGVLKVGLAFELQVVASVPSDLHDVRMDFVVTEERVIPVAATGSGNTDKEVVT